MQICLRTKLLRLILGTAVPLLLPVGDALSDAPLSVGRQAPAFVATDANGETFNLASHRGKRPLILVFYRGYF